MERPLLPLDIRRKTILELPYKDVLRACRSSPDLERVCATEKFWQDYNKYHYDLDPKLYSHLFTARATATFVEELLQRLFDVGTLPTVDSLKNVFSEEVVDTALSEAELTTNSGDAIRSYMADLDVYKFSLEPFIRGSFHTITVPFNESDLIFIGFYPTQAWINLRSTKIGRDFYKYMSDIATSPTNYFSPEGIITLPYNADYMQIYQFKDGNEFEYIRVAHTDVAELLEVPFFEYGIIVYYDHAYPMFEKLDLVIPTV